jgi:inhibitor of cysteine peptidase
MTVYNDPDKPIKVALNQTFAISLESNPSTGYTWEAEYDTALILLVKPKEFKLRSSNIGGGAEEQFEFQAKEMGETQIKMKYQREWEPAPLQEKVFKVYISQ